MAKFVNETSISRIHGQAWQHQGRLVVTMYHPAAGLHNQQLKDVIRADFRKLPGYIEQAAQVEPVAPAAPPPVAEGPRAILDAYALLVAARASAPEPPVAPTVAEPEAVFTTAVEPSQPTNGEPPDLAVPAAPAPAALDLAPPAPETSTVELPTQADVTAPPIPRRGQRRKAAAPAAVEVEAAPAPEPNPLLADALVTEPEAVAPSTNGHTAPVMDTALSPTPDPVLVAEEKPAAAGRKKSKPATDAEQLSMF
jgi:hypothetical protein